MSRPLRYPLKPQMSTFAGSHAAKAAVREIVPLPAHRLAWSQIAETRDYGIRRTCMFQINEADEAIGLASSWDL